MLKSISLTSVSVTKYRNIGQMTTHITPQTANLLVAIQSCKFGLIYLLCIWVDLLK